MADQHNANVPAVGNQISADIPDIKENLEWHKDILQMLCGWKDSTIATVGPSNHRATFTHSDDDTITIGGGSYFHDGTTRQTVFWDSALTFDLGSGGTNALSDNLGADEWHYIYLDDSAIVTKGGPELDNTCFLNDTTGPTWSHSKHGWYGNTVDKCVFAILTDADSDILEFFHVGDLVMFADSISSYSTASKPDDTWVDVTMSAPNFGQMKVETRFYGNSGADADLAQAFWRTNDQTGTTGHSILYIDADEVNYLEAHRVVITDSSQKIEIKYDIAGDHLLQVNTEGWYLPNGM
jgi:hypothetical protein